MFEKEAEEYTVENVCSSCYFEKPCENKCEAFGCADSKTYVLKAFKDGAEFGYNKANEWHDLRKNPNDLPKGHKVVLNQIGEKTTYDPDRGFLGFGGCGIIAWKEIPLFKESE